MKELGGGGGGGDEDMSRCTTHMNSVLHLMNIPSSDNQVTIIPIPFLTTPKDVWF